MNVVVVFPREAAGSSVSASCFVFACAFYASSEIITQSKLNMGGENWSGIMWINRSYLLVCDQLILHSLLRFCDLLNFLTALLEKFSRWNYTAQYSLKKEVPVTASRSLK